MQIANAIRLKLVLQHDGRVSSQDVIDKVKL